MTETDAPRQANIFASMKRGARVAFMGAALFLAACQSIVPKGPAPTTPTAPTRPTTPEVVQGLPTDTARHRVALLVPMSGANAGVGQSIANATTLALLDTKTDKVRITTYDTALGAAAAVNKALADGMMALASGEGKLAMAKAAKADDLESAAAEFADAAGSGDMSAIRAKVGAAGKDSRLRALVIEKSNCLLYRVGIGVVNPLQWPTPFL